MHIRFRRHLSGAGAGSGLSYVVGIDFARQVCSVISNSTLRRVSWQLLPVNDQSASIYANYCTEVGHRITRAVSVNRTT